MDRVWRLKTHLRAVSADYRVDFWADAEIRPGDQWYSAASDAISGADVFIACMSADYLASEFRYRMEWPRIMERARRAGAAVVPVILRPCAWFGFVDTFQAVPTDKGRVRPISEWRPQEAGYRQAATQIAEAVRQHFAYPGASDALASVAEEPAAVHLVPFAPAESEKLSPSDIDQAVKTVIGRRAAKSTN